jgi:hypothetical protein
MATVFSLSKAQYGYILGEVLTLIVCYKTLMAEISRKVQKLRRWVRALLHWLVEARRVWGPVLVIILVLIIASRLPLNQAEFWLRFCGFGFELLGILTVVSGLRDKQRLFNLPSFGENIRRWLDRRPRWGAKQYAPLEAKAGIYALSGMSAKLSVWRGTPADAPIEARLAALEANLATLKTEQAESAKEFQEVARKTNEAIDAERRARESTVTALRVQLEGLGAGGLHIEMMGIVWLFLGVVLTTFPGEIAAVLALPEVTQGANTPASRSLFVGSLRALAGRASAR